MSRDKTQTQINGFLYFYSRHVSKSFETILYTLENNWKVLIWQSKNHFINKPSNINTIWHMWNFIKFNDNIKSC